MSPFSRCIVSNSTRLIVWAAFSTLVLAQESPPPSPGPTPLDRLYLERLGEAFVLSRATAGKLWPGWGLEKTPVIIYEPGRVAYLVNHPRPPSDFERLPAKIPFLGPVFAKFGRDPRFTANTSLELGGASTACISFSSSPTSAEGPSLRFIALVFHESFHAFQTVAGKAEKGSVEAVLLRYPDFDAGNFALAHLEQIILFNLLRFDDTPDPAEVKRFLAVRAARERLLGPEFLGAERGIEYQEGIPTYLEVRLLEETREAVRANPDLGAGDPYSLRFALTHELRFADYYIDLLRFSVDSGAVRKRAYATGMALALVLDRMKADWKAEALKGDRYLDQILAERFPMTVQGLSRILTEAKDRHGYDRLLKLAESKLTLLREQRQQSGEAFLRQEGIQVLLHLPERPVELRNFDPMNIQAVDRSRAIHKRVLSLATGESSFRSSGVPVLANLGEGPFDIRSVNFFVPAEEIELELDFVPFELEPGGHEFDSLDLTGGGVTVRGSTGKLDISADRGKIEIWLDR